MTLSERTNRQDPDEIDIKKLISSLFEMRLFIFAGMALGLTVAAIVWYLSKHDHIPYYKTSISLRINEQTIQTGFEPEDLVREFDDVLSSPEYASIIYGKIFGQDGNLTKFGEIYPEAKFLKAMVYIGNQKKPFSVERSNSRNDYFLNCILPFKGLDKETTSRFVAALNDLSNLRNQRTLDMVSTPLLRLTDNTSETPVRLEMEKLSLERERELAAARIKLGQLRYRLIQDAIKSGINVSLLASIDSINHFSPVIQMTPDDLKRSVMGPSQEMLEMAKGNDRTQSLYWSIHGALVTIGKLKPDESEEQLKAMVEMEQHISLLRIEAHQNRFNLMRKTLGSAAIGLKFLPTFVENTQFNQATEIEQLLPDNFFVKVMFSGLLGGFCFGIVAGSLWNIVVERKSARKA